MIHPRVLVYKLASTIHWPPRRRAVDALLDELPAPGAEGRWRVVDVGCGPGLFVPTARAAPAIPRTRHRHRQHRVLAAPVPRARVCFQRPAVR